jgi:hypothetical protein
MFISPSCLYDDVEFTTSSHGLHQGKRLRTTGSYFRTYSLVDSAHPEATVYSIAGTKCLASVPLTLPSPPEGGEGRVRGTEARTCEPAEGIASGMPTSESALPFRVDP